MKVNPVIVDQVSAVVKHQVSRHWNEPKALYECVGYDADGNKWKYYTNIAQDDMFADSADAFGFVKVASK